MPCWIHLYFSTGVHVELRWCLNDKLYLIEVKLQRVILPRKVSVLVVRKLRLVKFWEFDGHIFAQSEVERQIILEFRDQSDSRMSYSSVEV